MSSSHRPLVFGTKENPVVPHEGTPKYPGGQKMWIEAALKYRVVSVAVGRRSGKTAMLDFLDWIEGGMCPDHYVSAFVGQSHAHAEKRYRARRKEFGAAGMIAASGNKGQDRFITIKPWRMDGYEGNKGATFFYWSGEEDAIDNTRGEGLHRLKVDEAGFVPEASMAALRPMVVDRNGKTIVTGTAKPEGIGFAWFRRYFNAGLDGKNRNPHYKSFNAPSESNPYLDPARVALERAECLSKAEEMCEYDGLFVEDDAAVFSNLDATFSITAYREEKIPGGWLWTAEDPEPDAIYVVGCDWGKFDDWTVISVFNLRTKRQVAVCAMTKIDYDEQFVTVHRLCERYGKPLIVADERGEGALCVERLRVMYGERVKGVKWSGGQAEDNDNNKSVYVTRGRLLCQTEAWSLMDVKQQREEFRLYQRTKRPRDNGYFFEAPPGHHDDFVSAALLAASRLQLPVPAAQRKIVTPSWWRLDEIDKRQNRRERVRMMLRSGF